MHRHVKGRETGPSASVSCPADRGKGNKCCVVGEAKCKAWMYKEDGNHKACKAIASQCLYHGWRWDCSQRQKGEKS